VPPPPPAAVEPTPPPPPDQVVVIRGTKRNTTEPPDVRITRYPTIEAQSYVRPNATFNVQVSLTTQPTTPEVRASVPGAGTQILSDGQLILGLPQRPAYRIDVVLIAGDFEILGDVDSQFIEMRQGEDSTPARFRLKPRSGLTLPTQTQIQATFWHEGRYLARATRPITVGEESGATGSGRDAGPQGLRTAIDTAASSVELAMNEGAPDMTILHLQDNRDGRSYCRIVISTRWTKPDEAPCATSLELAPWIETRYREIALAVPRGVTLESPERDTTAAASIALLKGFGRQLYAQFAPEPFQRQFWATLRNHAADFQTIQVFTNTPNFPWELLLPVSPDGEEFSGFLGTNFQIARWHLNATPTTRETPPARLRLERLTIIAPRYEGADYLPHQREEIESLQKVPGSVVRDGRFETVAGIMASSSNGIVHFAGHGEAATGASGVATYAIKLEDRVLDLTTWRGLRTSTVAHPLYFLNACQVGQSGRVAHFVDGWAPAILDSGASGFIGGIWPVSDAGASDLATRFYASLVNNLSAGARVTDLLRVVRRRFFETGDATYLSYVFYGDVYLRIVR
jgi:hypothetical protein